MKAHKLSPVQRSAYFRSLPDSILDRQLERAREKDGAAEAAANRLRKRHKKDPHLVALEDERYRRDNP